MSKKKHEEHENHERWLVSYADFITLLFAFFVVMYSISSVNEGRYRTVSESIKAALNPMHAPPAGNRPFQVGDVKPATIVPSLELSRDQVIRRLQVVMRSVNQVTQVSVQPVVEQRIGEAVLTISDNVLFKSGEATLQPDALPFLRGLAGVLLELDRHVRIEGHTDNVPIRSAQFPSNWELSAARAVMIVRTLSELYGVPAKHLAAIGYADTRPLAANLNPEQRAKNRRVEVVILESAPSPSNVRAEVDAEGTHDGSASPGSSDERYQPTLSTERP
jgi:chemotaxis protein MotB